MATCTSCGQDVADSDIILGEQGDICLSCDEAADRARASWLHPTALVGLVVAVVPFFFQVVHTSSGPDGTSYLDIVALAGGIGGISAGLVALVSVLRAPTRIAGQLALSAVVVALGVVQVLRAFGSL